ncbi:hypothetical protein [Pluralibacter sp.]|jgi:hypothetical protein|uniref:hypothetical protein n=1 Tax=Pluralibacter sp. TaxID=1920032 RepID=UPI0025F3E413|nr:hypothetical protein [Pluralibacter sp.]MBV8043978.1 hypothetical protein [Pluralibacter sp.]
MTLSAQFTTLAEQFRLGLSLDAALALPPLLKLLLPLLPTLPAQTQRQLPQIMSAILACQEREDWLGLADWLEYELCHALADPGRQDAEHFS